MSLVSHRYLHLWEHLQVLDFYDDSHVFFHPSEQPELLKTFAAFVNTVLALRKSRDIRKMRLSCAHSLFDTLYASSIDTCVRSAIGPHLEELHLFLFPSGGHEFRPPLSLFTNCPNLVSLSLCGGILVDVKHSSTVRLPSLKNLQLDIFYVDVNSVHALLSGCSILEKLDLSFAAESFSNLRVPPSLKSLKLTVENEIGACIQIDAPNLKYLVTTQITFGAVSNLHNVVEAHLDVFSPPGEIVSVDPLLNLLRGLSRTTYLLLGPSTTKWLLGAPVLDFPNYRHLRILELILPCFNSSFPFTVLQKCDVLQAFIIQNDKEPLPRRRRAPQPTSVPNCLLSHLTYIHFKGYEGIADELAFAEYILQKGLVLKMMIFADASVDLKEKHSILKRLSDIPRGSAICQLEFDSAVSS